MASASGRPVVEVRPFCIVSAEEEEVEFAFSRSDASSQRCRVMFLHKDIRPVERTLENNEHVIKWMARGLSDGILSIATLSMTDDAVVSSITPVLVLPRAAADEMREMFERAVQQEIKSELLLSPDRNLSDQQKSAIRHEVWRNHIQSFATDMDFLLNDMDEQWDLTDEEHNAMCEDLLKVFRNVFEFLKRGNAHCTIQYLIQACKERGVISFYSKYERDDVSFMPETTVALYEKAPRSMNGEGNDSDENNAETEGDESDFYSNFRVRRDGFDDNADSAVCAEQNEDMLSMECLCGFRSFDQFSRSGSLRSRTESDDDTKDPSQPVSPASSAAPTFSRPGLSDTIDFSIPHLSVAMSNPLFGIKFGGLFGVCWICLVIARILEQIDKSAMLLAVLFFAIITMLTARCRGILTMQSKPVVGLFATSIFLVGAYSLMTMNVAQSINTGK